MKENNGHIPLLTDDDKAHLPLYDFFIALKRNNFLVTPLQISDANRVIEKYGTTVQSETELCNYLAPVFANSQEEQIQFCQIFEDFFTPWLKLTPEKRSASSPGTKNEEDKKKKKSNWFKKTAWTIFSLLLLLLIYFLLKPAPPEIIKPHFNIDSNLSSADSGKTKRRIDVRIYPDTANNEFTYSIKYDWGDNTQLDTNSRHIYNKDSIYQIIAYIATYHKGSVKFNDTLTNTVAICSHPAEIRIEKSFTGDSITIGKEFALKAIFNGEKPASIKWTNSRQAVIGDDIATEIKTALYEEGEYNFTCNAFYGDKGDPCNTQASISFTVYDTTPKPHVIFHPAKDAHPITLQNKVYAYWFYLAGGLIILSLFFASFFALRRSRLKKQKNNSKEETRHQYDELIRSFAGKSGSVDIPFHNKNFLPVPEPELGMVARQMRKRINDDATYMDIEKSVSKAILNAGFFQAVISTRTQQSEFLALISRKNPNDQQTKLFDFLLDLLKKQNVLIDKYYYTNSLLTCMHETEHTEISLEKLSEKYPEHILLIFGEATELIYPDYPAIIPGYMALLNRWQYKAIMTPVSFSDWGNKEKKVLLQQLPVFPVDIAGQLLLMQKLFIEEMNIVAVLNQYSDEFYEAGMVDFEDLDELLDYCDEAAWAKLNDTNKYSNILFQWIAALAAYPKISWELTLAIGKAILDKSDCTQQLNFTNLLRLARISWMQAGKFPDYTRLNLLKKLTVANEITAREIILQLINEIPETELNSSHFAFEEKESQRLMNEFILYAHDPGRYKEYVHSKELFAKLHKAEFVTDVTTCTYLENPELQWPTLINNPVRESDRNEKPGNISLQNYLDKELEKSSLKARIYLWATSLSALLFIFSLLGLFTFIIFNISGSYSFPPFTHKRVDRKMIQINHYDSPLDTTTKNLTVTIDTISADFSDVNDYATDSIDRVVQLYVLIDGSAKEMIVNWNQNTIFDTSISALYDAYDLELTNKDVPLVITANLLLNTDCKAGFNIYKKIISAVDSNINVKQTDVIASSPQKHGNKDEWCLNTISYGSSIDKNKVDSIIAGFLDYGIKLEVGQSKFVAGSNDILIFNSKVMTNIPTPVVYILVSDSSLIASADKFKNELESNGLKAKAVALSSFSYNSDIYYYSKTQQLYVNKINNLYHRYFPALNVQAHLAKFPPGQALTDTNAIVVWIKMLEKPKSLNGLNINKVHYQSPDKSITGDFYVNPKTNKWEEFNNDPYNNGRIKLMKLISKSEDAIKLQADDGANIIIDLTKRIINIGRDENNYIMFYISDGKDTQTFSPPKRVKRKVTSKRPVVVNQEDSIKL